MSSRLAQSFALALLSAMLSAAAPVHTPPEPDSDGCKAAVARARDAVHALAPGSIARKFADFDLVQAQAEAGNGEFDDCMDYAANALDEVRHPHHQQTPDLKPAKPHT